MSRTPTVHQARSHAQLLDAMERHARSLFIDGRRRWDPHGAPTGTDAGQGVLDCVAAALDVVWGYQHAWADEAFLPLAQLPDSATRLLSLIGHAPRPALSAACFQHLRMKPGAVATIPPGFALSAPAEAGGEEAVFETSEAIHADHRLNQLQPVATVPPPIVESVPPSLTLAPPPRSLPSSSTSLAEQLASRLQAAQHGAALARDAARARSDALKLADLASTLSDSGGADSCPEVFQDLCDQLCTQAQTLLDTDAAAAAADPLPMSEAQQLLMGSLARIDSSFPEALAGLEDAVCQIAGESDTDYAARLNGLAGFLDVLVEGILAQARDDVVRLRGPRGLSPLDRARRGALTPGELGVALPGTDRVYLLPFVNADGPSTTHGSLLRPGDYLAFADLVEERGAKGNITLQQRGREVVRVVRVDDQFAPPLGERATHLVFTPPLSRRYDLARSVMLGNVVPVTHGRTKTLSKRGPGPWPLPDVRDLSWLPDPSAADGRRPAVSLLVGGETWTLTPDVMQADPDDRVFDVLLRADGVPVVRTGDGVSGAVVPPDAEVQITVRAGTGSAGNRAPGAINQINAPVPEVVGTTNPLEASGGVDGEPADDSRTRAVGGVRTLDRAVTPDDIVALLLGHGLVARAAITAPEESRPRRLRAVVTGPGGRELTPSEHTTLKQFLAARVPPGVTVNTINRTIVPLRATIELAVSPTSDPLAILAESRARLGVDVQEGGGLLHPDHVQLGTALHLSDLHAALHGVQGLEYIAVEALHRDGEPSRRAEVVSLSAREEARWAPAVDGVDGVVLRWGEAVDA